MEEAPKIPPQDKIKREFLSGEMSPGEFLEQVKNLDQSDQSRQAAPANATLLESEEIGKKFVGTELESQYFHDISLYRFHEGQILAVANSTIESLTSFRRALHAAEQSKISSEDWTMYVRATIAYLEQDEDLLRDIVSVYPSHDEHGRNTTILRNFLKGLETRGTVDYRADYSKLD